MCMGEIKSGKFSIYAQWMSWLSIILCISIGLGSLIDNFIFAVISVAEGGFIFLLEMTFVTKIIRGTDKILAISTNIKWKAAVYIGLFILNLRFGMALWASILITNTMLLLNASVLTLAGIFWVVAWYKGEENIKSEIVDKKAIARTVISNV